MKRTLTHSLYSRNRIMLTESSGKYDSVSMILYLKHVFGLLIVLSLFVTCHAQDALKITGLETRVLAKADGRWFGRATVEQTVDGTIVLCYREAAKHTGSDGVIHVRFSKDGGHTWSAPDHTVDNSPIAGFPVSFEEDDAFEPYLYLAPNGRLILHVWRTTGRDHRLGKGTWQRDSSDNGRTWSKLRQVDFVGIEHDDRCYATDDHTIVDGAIYTSLREFIGGEQGWQCKFIQSPDNGESWRVVSEHINVPEHNSVEKGFEYVGEDRIVCIGSEGPGRRHVLQTHSDDLGQTWKRWTDALPETGVWDRPRIWTLAHLKGQDQWWKDRTLIGVGNTTPAAGRKFPRANAVYISTDRGATWKMLGGKPIDKFYPDGGYGDLVYDQATDTFVYVSYRATGIHGSGEIVQYRFRLGATDQPPSGCAKPTSSTVLSPSGKGKGEEKRDCEVVLAQSLSDFRDLVRTETWTEKWPDASGKIESRSVTAEIWTRAMQASLDAQGLLHIPARKDPYYLDGPLILKSGQSLTADAQAEIRLKPGCNTCMVRNANLTGFKDRPVPEDTKPDTEIHIEGGIWTTLATARTESNGNIRGFSSKQNPVFGTHGVILLHNVRRVSVKNITVRQSKPFAIHFGNARDFTVDGLTLDDHRRDGVHVNGPASNGVIRRVSGTSHDDPVALNAWEWKNYAPSYGPIRDVLIEDLTGAPEGVPAANAIRLLPGVKRFDDGTTLACPLEDITLRRITDIREFKLYDQPNLELGRDKDFSIGVGTLKNIRFEDLVFNRPGVIELHANTDGLAIQNVRLNFPITPDYHLLAIGPKSQTYKYGRSGDPARWAEIFSPDLDCTVRNLSVSGVRTRDSQTDLPIEQIVHIIEQQLNPDYPNTTPRGGTGKGIWIR